MIKSFLGFISIFFLFSANQVSAKTFKFSEKKFLTSSLVDTIPQKDSIADDIFESVEIEASFNGGDEAWIKFLEKNLDATVPYRMRAPKGKYTVWVQFIVAVDGSLSEFVALTNNGYGMEKEVIRVLKKSPRWKPAIQDGRKVKAYRKQPITFVVAE